MIKEGFIIRSNAGLYDVFIDGEIYVSKPRGKFRKELKHPLVGDNVVIETLNEKEGYIVDIKDRVNFLIRPKVANIEQLVIIASLVDPVVEPSLINRFMMLVSTANIKPILLISKCDREDFPMDKYLEIERVYKNMGYVVMKYSSKTNENVDAIKELLKGHKTVFTGQTGVGKSRLINSLLGVNQKVGETSKALGRGRHTTRLVEYIPYGEDWIADTPGFSLIDFDIIRIDKEELSYEFPGFRKYFGKCKFRGCLHDSEPNCKVKEAVENGEIEKVHYETYLGILNELKNRRERY